MTGHRRSTNARRRTAEEGWPLVVLMAVIGFGLIGYLVVGELVLAARPHPLHWAAGVVGGIVGYLAGWLWYRWRGDVL